MLAISVEQSVSGWPVDESTVQPSQCRVTDQCRDADSKHHGYDGELGTRMATIGVQHLDAPVFGTTDHAARGDAYFCVSGTIDALPIVEPCMRAMGRAVRVVGEAVMQAASSYCKMRWDALLRLQLLKCSRWRG